MLLAVGTRHRFVVAHQPTVEYKKVPTTRFPAAALVLGLRKPDEFRKGIETALRAGGLALTFQFGLKMSEEKRHGYDILTYRFDESRDLPADVGDTRLNISPSFALVGDQYVFASTRALCREIVDQLHAESKLEKKSSPVTSRTKFFASGVKDTLKTFEEQLIAAAVLGQALPLDQAKAQVQATLKLFDLAEGLTTEEAYGENEFHYDIRLKYKK
jgi:hypothetical protein